MIQVTFKGNILVPNMFVYFGWILRATVRGEQMFGNYFFLFYYMFGDYLVLWPAGMLPNRSSCLLLFTAFGSATFSTLWFLLLHRAGLHIVLLAFPPHHFHLQLPKLLGLTSLFIHSNYTLSTCSPVDSVLDTGIQHWSRQRPSSHCIRAGKTDKEQTNVSGNGKF